MSGHYFCNFDEFLQDRTKHIVLLQANLGLAKINDKLVHDETWETILIDVFHEFDVDASLFHVEVEAVLVRNESEHLVHELS